ncbi:hypothetical protein BCO18430_07441 [Burkholderia contaminans]|uniref:hypothetical protein n=1 Tax=Burkholderia contaminans TaxID=488447 RepID=UPI0014546C6C|nr:hypothetical protein [Burkholderia contaminans]VWD50461.1 hypothetical protein BCO18430_07441 [Burkholderia contaminans]
MDSTKESDRDASSFPKPRGLFDHYADLVESLAGLKVSRRSALLGAATLAAGIPLIGWLVRAAGRFTVDLDRDIVTIGVGGIEVWRIDRRWFDGKATLSARRTESRLYVRMRHGYFPGTDLPADMTLYVKRAGPEWIARLVFDGLGFDAQFPFHIWLLGYRRAMGRVDVEHVRFSQAREIRMQGLRGNASFGPDWTFDLPEVRHGMLNLGRQGSALLSVRIDLISPASVPSPETAPTRRVTAFWPKLGGGTSIDMPGTTPRASISASHADWYVQASPESARLLASQRSGVSHLHWPGAPGMRLEAQRLEYALDLAGHAPTAAGRAQLSDAGWQDAGAVLMSAQN